RGGGLIRVRRDDPGGHLARLHVRRDAGEAPGCVPGPVLHRLLGGTEPHSVPVPLADRIAVSGSVRLGSERPSVRVALHVSKRDADPLARTSPITVSEPDVVTEHQAQPHCDAEGARFARPIGPAIGSGGPDHACGAAVTSARSSGIDAITAVPRPGVDRTANVPLASSTRSRIDASPTRPARRWSRTAGGS